MKRDSFVFYRSFAEAMDNLPPKQFKNAFRTLYRYALDGDEPEDADAITEALFKLMKPQIDANNRRYENGKKGGAKQGNKNANKNASKEAKPKEKKQTEELPAKGEPMPAEMRKKFEGMFQ